MPEADARKDKSHRRILEAASRSFRAAGLEGAGVAQIMAEAGLTHGGFYAHFPDKAALAAAALGAAMTEGRGKWLAGLEGLPPEEAYRRIVGRYLSRPHRDDPASGCAMAALGSELARSEPDLHRSFEAAFQKTVAALEPHMPALGGLGPHERALATAALCVGGLLLSRMVEDRELSDAILRACRRTALAALPSAPQTAPAALSPDARSR
jgi:TetR/AcrR family transcriptional repressor of nem operon